MVVLPVACSAIRGGGANGGGNPGRGPEETGPTGTGRTAHRGRLALLLDFANAWQKREGICQGLANRFFAAKPRRNRRGAEEGLLPRGADGKVDGMNLEIPGYSITRSIGNGGMTKLYVALDPQQNRYVIRVLNADSERDRRSRKRFQTGAEVLRALHTPKPHPNIVRLVKTGVENGRSYMVLQYVESRTLRDLILNRDPMLAQNPIVFIRQLARVVQYVHAKGFLHLDIKPENLLIQPDGRLVLIDFDLAVPRKRFFKKLPTLAGTTAYMPPEMLATRIADDRSDVYAFGVTCYEMLTFHKPFEGEKIEQVQAAQVDPAIPPTPIRQHNPAVPHALAELVMKCIAKKPEDRYPDMVLVLRDLDRLS